MLFLEARFCILDVVMVVEGIGCEGRSCDAGLDRLIVCLSFCGVERS